MEVQHGMKGRLKALQRAVDKLGGQNGTARELSVAQSTVNYWLTKKHEVPAEYAGPLEAKSGISRHKLRPDIFGEES